MKAVIFDLDGLLIDSETTIWPKSITEFLLSKGILYTDEVREKARGSGHKETIEIFKKNLDLKGNIENLVAEMRSYFFKNFLLCPALITGSKEFLEGLSKKEYLLAVATGLGPKNCVIDLLSRLEIKKYFKLICESHFNKIKIQKYAERCICMYEIDKNAPIEYSPRARTSEFPTPIARGDTGHKFS